MRCPFCNASELKVTDSRDASDGNAIRRRRQCLTCLRRFTTFETIELTLQVHKRDGRFEEFQRQKLIKGLQMACLHTTVSIEQVEAITDAIILDLLQNPRRSIETSELGEMAIEKLRKLDSIAYIRFACVYKRFKHIGDLEDEISNIQAYEE